jgi:hypothetical protein
VIRIEAVEIPAEEYVKIFAEAFGEYDESHLPHHIFYIYEDDKRIAFCSVYGHGMGTLYLQTIGFTNSTQKRYNYYKETIRQLHALGFPFILGAISNVNTPALMWALMSGFKIIGTRTASNGEIFVEILREQKDYAK